MKEKELCNKTHGRQSITFTHALKHTHTDSYTHISLPVYTYTNVECKCVCTNMRRHTFESICKSGSEKASSTWSELCLPYECEIRGRGGRTKKSSFIHLSVGWLVCWLVGRIARVSGRSIHRSFRPLLAHSVCSFFLPFIVTRCSIHGRGSPLRLSSLRHICSRNHSLLHLFLLVTPE